MIQSIAGSIFAFCCLLGLIMLMFAHAFYLRLAHRDDADFDFHADDPNPFGSVSHALFTLYKFILGDFDDGAFLSPEDKALFVLYMFFVVIVMLNILIAIVSDSYDDGMVRSESLFWLARLGMAQEYQISSQRLRNMFFKLSLNLSVLRGELKVGEEGGLGAIVRHMGKTAKSYDSWTGRVLDIEKRVEGITKTSETTLGKKLTKLAESNAELETKLGMKFDAIMAHLKEQSTSTPTPTRRRPSSKSSQRGS